VGSGASQWAAMRLPAKIDLEKMLQNKLLPDGTLIAI
jgi:hypothetical protein